MGPNPDHGHVVDAHGAVHGINGLWVADASVMPAIPAANTNLSTIVRRTPRPMAISAMTLCLRGRNWP
jgi:choline dehydrogenase-like flavoprotein